MIMSAAEMDDRRMNQRLRELSNGGWEEMDPTTRRCLMVIADELDQMHRTERRTRSDLLDMEQRFTGELSDTRKALIAMMSAIIVTVIATGIINAVWK